MFLSKNAKRFMSTAAVLAMTVASLVVAPKVQAADGGNVKVGPKTISEAKISVREDASGIRYMVSATLPNDYTDDLGIELTVGEGASKKISLQTGATNLYSLTNNEDGSVTVQYSVVVKDIPASERDTVIKAKGFAKDQVSAEVSRTVTEAAQMAGYTFDENGFLVKDVPKPVAVDLATYTKSEGNSIYKEDSGTIVFNDSEGKSTGSIKLPTAVELGEKITVTIKGTYSGNTGFRIWLGNGVNALSDPQVYNTDDIPQGEFEKTCTFTAKEDKEGHVPPASYLTIKGIIDWSGQGPKGNINGLTISEITVLYPQNS